MKWLHFPLALLLLSPSWLTGAGAALPKGSLHQLTPGVLDVNLASAADFDTLPGIGPALAGRIVTFREKHGPFRRIEDLLVIPGIGSKKWKAMRAYLRVGMAENRH